MQIFIEYVVKDISYFKVAPKPNQFSLGTKSIDNQKLLLYDWKGKKQ